MNPFFDPNTVYRGPGHGFMSQFLDPRTKRFAREYPEHLRPKAEKQKRRAKRWLRRKQRCRK